LAKSVADSLTDVDAVIAAGRDAGVPVEVSISAAFGDPYEGDVAPARVVELAARFADAGATGVSLGDTTGMAWPDRVSEVLDRLGERLPGLRINLHLHDTRRTAMANALAGLEAGVTELDASVGGLGGSPFAPGGGNGNLATEELVAVLEEKGIRTGVDPAALAEASTLATALVGRPLP
jgi:hydroxymethylglutaryl-CoA lyase